MNDEHVIALATIFQVFLLAVNAGLIAWYLWETRMLRRSAQEQVAQSQRQLSEAHEQLEVMRQQVAISRDQSEAQIRPALTVTGVNPKRAATAANRNYAERSKASSLPKNRAQL